MSRLGRTGISLILLGILIGGGIVGAAAYFWPRGSPTDSTPTPNLNFARHQLYDATPPPPITRPPTTVKVTLEVLEHVVEISPNIFYHGWTFNGTIPGPVIRVRVNDIVQFTLDNGDNSTQPHSVDFHSIQGPMAFYYQSANPGNQFKVNFNVTKPGVYMYHCGTPSVPSHITHGMYGMIIVDPAGGFPLAREYALVQSEFYTRMDSDGVYTLDETEATSGSPDYQTFNGFANQYAGGNSLQASVGEKVRIFVVNAGPNVFSAFHAIGDIFDRVYEEGSLTSQPLEDVQTATVAPGGSTVFELAFDEAGDYPLVSHAIWALNKGLVGMVHVTTSNSGNVISDNAPAQLTSTISFSTMMSLLRKFNY